MPSPEASPAAAVRATYPPTSCGRSSSSRGRFLPVRALCRSELHQCTAELYGLWHDLWVHVGWKDKSETFRLSSLLKQQPSQCSSGAFRAQHCKVPGVDCETVPPPRFGPHRKCFGPHRRGFVPHRRGFIRQHRRGGAIERHWGDCVFSMICTAAHLNFWCAPSYIRPRSDSLR